MGIEPTLEAWEAAVLPLNYTRSVLLPESIIATVRLHHSAKLSPMKIFLNGESKQIPENLAVAGLLAELDLADKRVAVEVNGTIVPRSRHGEHLLAENDKLEIVVAVGGG